MDTIQQRQQQQQMGQQMQHQDQQAHQAQPQQGAPRNVGNERQSQQLNLRGFDNIETFSGGEGKGQNWSWKIQTAVSGVNGELVEMLNATDTSRMENTEAVLREGQFVSFLVRDIGSEASTTVKSGTELDLVGVWARLHANDCRRTVERMFRVQRECMSPKPAKDVGQVRLGDHAVGGEVESDDVRAWRRREDSRFVEDVGVVGNLSKRCEGTNVDEIGRDR